MLFESCVGEAVGTMAVASFVFSSVGTFGCRFRCLLGAFVGLGAALGVPWGGHSDFLGS